MYLCGGGLLAVHVSSQAKVLQICWFVFHFIWEGHHRLGSRGLQLHNDILLKVKLPRICAHIYFSVCAYVFVDLGRLGLQGHQAGWSVCQDMEVRGGWGTHRSGPALRVHLVVDQTPLLQEGVDSAAGGHIIFH